MEPWLHMDTLIQEILFNLKFDTCPNAIVGL
jgi:hypothetical protein